MTTVFILNIQCFSSLFIHFFVLDLYPKLYPELFQYMGLSLNEEEIHANMGMVPGAPTQGVCKV